MHRGRSDVRSWDHLHFGMERQNLKEIMGTSQVFLRALFVVHTVSDTEKTKASVDPISVLYNKTCAMNE